METVQLYDLSGKNVEVVRNIFEVFTNAKSVEESFGIFRSFCCDESGTIVTNESVLALYAILPNPCPRRKRAFEWDQLLPFLDFGTQEIQDEFRAYYCRYAVSNFYNASVTSDEFFKIFDGYLKDEDLSRHIVDLKCRQIRTSFDQLTSAEQLSWEVTKWEWSGVPRPEFYVLVLFMLKLIAVVEVEEHGGDPIIEKDVHGIGQFCKSLNLGNDMTYLRKQLSPLRIMKVYFPSFSKNANFTERLQKESKVVVVVSEVPSPEHEKKAQSSLKEKRKAYFRDWRAKRTEGS